MSQITEMKRELRAAKKLRLSWLQRLMILVIGAPATFLLALYGRLELAWPLMMSIGVLWFVIWLKWDLRRSAWFWITIAAVGSIHLAIILLVPWSSSWRPAAMMAGLGALDFLLILWLILFVEKVMGKTSQQPRQ